MTDEQLRQELAAARRSWAELCAAIDVFESDAVNEPLIEAAERMRDTVERIERSLAVRQEAKKLKRCKMDIKSKTELEHMYYGSTVHGKPGIMGDYVKHNIGFYKTIEIDGKESLLEFQTGNRFYNNDFQLPVESLDFYPCDDCDERIEFVFNSYGVDEVDEDSPVTIEQWEKIREFLDGALEEAKAYMADLNLEDDPDKWQKPEEYSDSYWTLKPEESEVE